jgi:hypothetical protein
MRRGGWGPGWSHWKDAWIGDFKGKDIVLVMDADDAGQIIRFPILFAKICPILCLTKAQAWLVLKELQTSGRIDIVPY